jgi:RimJ/RimL family protein N-acetyltransferase
MPAPNTPPILTDGVVTLRAHRTDDLDRIVEQCLDPVSIAWTTVPVPYDRAMAEEFALQVLPGGWTDGSEWAFAVEVEGRYAGTVSLRDEGPGRAEIAYGSHPDVRGTGTLLRALRLLVEWGFEELDLQTMVWQAFTGNWSSRKLAWRLGFRVEGTLRRYLPQRGDERRDAWIGTLLRDDPREPATTWLEVPVLEGDGFRLRPVTVADAPRIQEGCSDPESQRWLGHIPAPYTLDDALEYVERRSELQATGQAVSWAIADREDDRLLGTVMWFNWTAGVECEVGYWIHPGARGRGLATRVTRLVVDHVFDTLRVQRVTAFAAAGNVASRRVIEAAGLRLYGIERYGAWVRDDHVDMALYDVTSSEWSTVSRSTANATASTTNPASDSAAPITSGDR